MPVNSRTVGNARSAIGKDVRRLLGSCIITAAMAMYPTWTMARPDGFALKELAKRSPDIHWPVELSPEESAIFAHTEIDINAPASTVWKNLILAERWPRWYVKSTDVHVLGDSDALGKGTDFYWTTLGARITSMVRECAPVTRLGWITTGQYGVGYHNWLIIPTTRSSCHIINEFAMSFDPGVGSRRYHNINEEWLKGLKKCSEKPGADLVQEQKRPKLVPGVNVGPLTGH
jgi:hypothetical protein